jgi:CubicO group peptidase (beta-lactamase class C family)
VARSGGSWSGVCRVLKDGEVIRETTTSRGCARAGRRTTAATRFQAGLISKMLLATVVLRLVHRGALALHTPVGAWVEDLPVAGQRLTLHQLLSHPSGLAHWDALPSLDINALPERQLPDVMLAAADPLRPPGAR